MDKSAQNVKLAGRQSGFTLIELLVVVVVMGVVMSIFSSTLTSMFATQEMAKNERLRFENMEIGRAMLDFASLSSARDGSLPTQGALNGSSEPALALPYSTPSRQGNIAAGTDAEIFVSAIEQRGLTMHDAREAGNRGRYYALNTTTLDVPLSGIGSESVSLTVDEAVVFADNENGDGALVNNFGDLASDPALQSSLFGYRFSNRALQQSMLITTNKRLERLMSAIANAVSLDRLAADPVDATSKNFYPGASMLLSGSVSMTSAPGAGCTHDWIDLSDATPGSSGESVMQFLGLTQQEYGQTAWGGRVLYCYDYDESGMSKAPYFGAILLSSQMKGGSVNSGNDILLMP